MNNQTHRESGAITLGFIGAGTVGTALAIRLNAGGYPVIAVSSKSRTSAEKLAKQIQSHDKRALRAIKQAVTRGLDLPLDEGLALEARLARQLANIP